MRWEERGPEGAGRRDLVPSPRLEVPERVLQQLALAWDS